MREINRKLESGSVVNGPEIKYFDVTTFNGFWQLYSAYPTDHYALSYFFPGKLQVR